MGKEDRLLRKKSHGIVADRLPSHRGQKADDDKAANPPHHASGLQWCASLGASVVKKGQKNRQ